MGGRRLDAFALSPLPCDDCRYCYRVDGCSKPDLKEFYTALEEADALALVTPVYNRSFPAPLKALLDRTQRYWAARFIRGIRPPITRPKQAFLLTAAGSGGDDAACVEPTAAPRADRTQRPSSTAGGLVRCGPGDGGKCSTGGCPGSRPQPFGLIMERRMLMRIDNWDCAKRNP